MIPDFGESDVLHFHLPLKNILAGSLKNNEWPVWSPFIASGFPVLAESQIGTFFLPNLILYRLLPTVPAYNISLALSFLTAGIGMYVFCRSLRLSMWPSLFAAIVFSFSGYFAVQLNHVDVIQTASFLPFVFWSLYRIYRRPNVLNSLLLSFFLSQQLFAGYINTAFTTLVGGFIFLAALMILKFQSVKTSIKVLVLITTGCAVAGLLSSIQLIPTIELWLKSTKSGGVDFATATQFPYPYKHIITFLFPFFRESGKRNVPGIQRLMGNILGKYRLYRYPAAHLVDFYLTSYPIPYCWSFLVSSYSGILIGFWKILSALFFLYIPALQFLPGSFQISYYRHIWIFNSIRNRNSKNYAIIADKIYTRCFCNSASLHRFISYRRIPVLLSVSSGFFY
jgi:hypothetical protein